MSSMDRNAFIAAMRGVAHSVTVVTTNGEAGRHGSTVSAFCSVSADPPTALVCLNANSRIAQLVLKNRFFNINVLPEGAKHIADRFAGLHDNHIADRFEGIDLNQTAIPALRNASVFSCEVDQAILSGSHQIIIGHVRDVQSIATIPLTYLDGSYQQIQPIKDLSNEDEA